MEELTGCIEHLTYQDEESFFTVASLLCPGKTKPVVITGTLPAVQVGETISCKGEWKRHPKHGLQFDVQAYELQLPQDARSIEKYLASGALRGIGKKFASKIVAKFGKQTLQVIDKQPKMLQEVEGLGEKRRQQLVASWEEHKSLNELLIFFQGYGISRTYAKKILRAYGSFALQKIKQNPFQLAKEIRGIGFKLADQIAKNLGFASNSPERIAAGIDFVLYELSQTGHVCYPLTAFVERATETLAVEAALIQDQLGKQLQAGEIEIRRCGSDDLFIWSKVLYHCEQGIASEISRLQQAECAIRQVNVSKAIEWAQERLRIRFAPLQCEAICQALQEKVSIITGGPGTGKSTITKAILCVLGKLTNKIILAAPTGRAAKRLAEITRHYASTIHRILKFDFTKGAFKYDKDTPLTCDLVIIDETSMIDTYLMFQLLRAIPSHAKVVLIGDVNQLPSIGPGTVLADLIASEKISLTKLTAIFRQAAGSQIIVNAHRINEGKMPFTQSLRKSDFLFVEAKEPEEVTGTILTLVTKTLPEKYPFDPKKDIQVLAPMKKGICGIDILNQQLQQALTPKNDAENNGYFRVGDKVMQTRNNYTKDVFNGDIGTIVAIDPLVGSLSVEFDEKIVPYEVMELDELALAYAVSVHKFQGSECPCVVMPVHTSHFKLLTKNLLYTGVTRGKKLVVVVGTKKALAIAVKNEDVDKRYTGLYKT